MLLIYYRSNKNIAAYWSGMCHTIESLYHENKDLILTEFNGLLCPDREDVMLKKSDYIIKEDSFGNPVDVILKPKAILKLDKNIIRPDGIDTAILSVDISDIETGQELVNIDIFFGDTIFTEVTQGQNHLEMPIISNTPGVVEITTNREMFRTNVVKLEVLSHEKIE
jgi:hypothetical protein